LSYDISEGPLFINSVDFVPGANWDSNIDIINYGDYGFISGYDTVSGQNVTYQLGTELTASLNLFFSIATRQGAVNSSVTPGVYDFNTVFKGGTSGSASDVLADLAFRLQVVPRLDVNVTTSFDRNVIWAGGPSAYATMTVTNNMSNDFVTTTWFYTSARNGSNFLMGTFLGDWWDEIIPGGQSLTDFHSKWDTQPSNPPGIYTGKLGVVGGLHQGDEHYLPAPEFQLEVAAVPEPLSLAGLGGGLLALLAARRRNRATKSL